MRSLAERGGVPIPDEVARAWAGGIDAEARVEVDVHGKRLIVSRQQVRRLAP